MKTISELETELAITDDVIFSVTQWVKKRSRLSWLTNCALAYNKPECGGGEEFVASQPMSTTVHNAHGAQINLGDLTPYLTYGITSHNSMKD